MLEIFYNFYSNYVRTKTCFDGILKLGFDQYYGSFKKPKYENLIFCDDDLIYIEDGTTILYPFKARSKDSLVLMKLCSDEGIFHTWDIDV